jgi:hypothetical protein
MSTCDLEENKFTKSYPTAEYISPFRKRTSLRLNYARLKRKLWIERTLLYGIARSMIYRDRHLLHSVKWCCCFPKNVSSRNMLVACVCFWFCTRCEMMNRACIWQWSGPAPGRTVARTLTWTLNWFQIKVIDLHGHTSCFSKQSSLTTRSMRRDDNKFRPHTALFPGIKTCMSASMDGLLTIMFWAK